MTYSDYISAFRRRWRVIVVTLLIVWTVTFFNTVRSGFEYQSTTRLFITTTAQTQTDPLQAGSFAIQRVITYASLVTGRELASRVVSRLNLKILPSDFSRKLSAAGVPGTVLLDITAADPQPRLAQLYSQTAAEELTDYIRDVEKPAGDGRPAVQAAIVDPADLPVAPDSPNTVLNLFLAIVVGLLLGGGLAVAREKSQSNGPTGGVGASSRVSSDSQPDS
jgi:receptor protein-tyrosine kinase